MEGEKQAVNGGGWANRMLQYRGGANRLLVEGEGQTGCWRKGQIPLESTSLDVTLLKVHCSNQPTGNVQLLLVGTSFSRSPAGTGPILSPMTFRRNLHVAGWSSPQ